jgi:hypothetical protein
MPDLNPKVASVGAVAGTGCRHLGQLQLAFFFLHVIETAFTLLATFGVHPFPVVVFQGVTGYRVRIPPVFRVSHELPPVIPESGT